MEAACCSRGSRYCRADILPGSIVATILNAAICWRGTFEYVGHDFRNTGVHFAEKLRDAGLHSGSHVLDIGSGCGRVAIPLTEIIDLSGSYSGLELCAPLVHWCSSRITPKYPHFRFVRCDLKNPHYPEESTL